MINFLADCDRLTTTVVSCESYVIFYPLITLTATMLLIDDSNDPIMYFPDLPMLRLPITVSSCMIILYAGRDIRLASTILVS